MSFMLQIKFIIKLCVEMLLRIILRLFYVFPLKNNRILFNGNCGHDYSGNPKYIYEKILDKYDALYEIYWVIRNPEVLPSDVKFVKIHTVKMAYIALTSKVLVVDDAYPAYMPFRKKQVVLDTWHGGGAYKKIGKDFGKYSLLELIAKLAMKHISIFLSTNKRFSQVTSHALGIPLEKFWEIGMPREDILFHVTEQQKHEIRDRIHLSENQKLALYAPTFRGNAGINAAVIPFLDIEQSLNALKKRWPGDWILGIKFHTILKDSQEDQTNYLKLTDYPDMQELLCISDVLITDYSSCMWDASLMGKPCFILAPDKNQYISERDFYTPMDQWPYPIAESNIELSNNIVNYNERDYRMAVQAHHMELGITETGCAADLVADAIFKMCFKNYIPSQIIGDSSNDNNTAFAGDKAIM